MKQQSYQTNTEYIESMMKRFKLVDMREQYRDLIREAESSSMGYEDFLVRLLNVEEEGKRGRRTDKLRKEACFETEKSRSWAGWISSRQVKMSSLSARRASGKA